MLDEPQATKPHQASARLRGTLAPIVGRLVPRSGLCWAWFPTRTHDVDISDLSPLVAGRRRRMKLGALAAADGMPDWPLPPGLPTRRDRLCHRSPQGCPRHGVRRVPPVRASMARISSPHAVAAGAVAVVVAARGQGRGRGAHCRCRAAPQAFARLAAPFFAPGARNAGGGEPAPTARLRRSR